MHRQIWVAVLTLILALPCAAEEVGTMSIPVPGGWALAPDRTTLVVAATDKGQLIYIDTVAEKELKRVDLDFKPTCIVIQGTKMFVATKGASKVCQLDLDTGKMQLEFKLTGEPTTVLVGNSDKGPIFAANTNDEITMIDTETGQHHKTSAHGMYLALSPDGKYLYTGTQKPIKDELIIQRSGNMYKMSVAQSNKRAFVLKYEVGTKSLKLVGANDNAAINGRALTLSSDGKRFAMAGGGGWESKNARKANYVIAVFETDDMKTQVGEVATGAYPNNIAFHPALNIGVAEQSGGNHRLMLFNSKSLADIGKLVAGGRREFVTGQTLLGFAAKGTKAIWCSAAPDRTGLKELKDSTLYLFQLDLDEEQKKTLAATYGEVAKTPAKPADPATAFKGLFTKPEASKEPVSYLKITGSPGDSITQGKNLEFRGDQLKITRTDRGVKVLVDGWMCEIGAPKDKLLKVGEYTDAQRYSFSGDSPGLEFSGKGRGVNKLTGEFAVWELEFKGDQVTKLAIDFVQRATVGKGKEASLTGKLRFNSSFE
jgi:hypothetical protein